MKNCTLFLLFFILLSLGSTSFAQNWSEVQKVVASNRTTFSLYGTSVAVYGDYAVVGAPGYNSSAGIVYVLERNTSGQWIQVKSLEDPNKASNDFFGNTVAIYGDRIAVGAPNATFVHGGQTITGGGKAVIFERDLGGSWGYKATVRDPTPQANAQFSSSIALDSNTLVCGSPYYDLAGFLDVGVVRIFDQISGNWTSTASIAPPMGYAAYDLMGYAVDIDGNTIITTIGRRGQVTVYEKTSSWNLAHYLSNPTGNGADYFGNSIALHNDAVVVGAPNHDGQGAAYLFEKNNNAWSLVDTFYANNRTANDQFGFSVDIYDNTVLVGANYESEDINNMNTFSKAGSAFLFKKTGTGIGNWNFAQKLIASDRNTNDNFGTSLSLSGNYAFIGAPGESEDATGANSISNAGSSYIYEACVNSRTDSITACAPYTWYGSSYTSSGTYNIVVPSPSGCDSLLQLNLIVPVYTGVDTINTCEPYSFGSSIYYTNSTLIDSLQTPDGCDSIVTIALTVDPNWNESYVYKSNLNNFAAIDTDIDGDFAVTSFLNGTARHLEIFQKDNNGAWTSIQTINNSSGNFGARVVMSGDFIAVVADTFSPPNTYTHKVFLYKKGAGNIWSLDQTLLSSTAQNTSPNGQGGLAIDNGLLAVGFPYYDYSTTTSKYGQIKIYHYIGSQWDPVQTITNPSFQTGINGEFGVALAIDNNRIAVGHPGATVNSQNLAGKVHVYQYYSGGGLSPIGIFSNSDAKAGDRLGSGLAISQGMVAAGFAGRSYTVGSGPGSYTGTSGGVRIFKKNIANNNWTQTANIPSYANAYFEGSDLGKYLDADDGLLVVSDTRTPFQGVYGTGEGDIRLFLVDTSGSLSLVDQLRTIDLTERFGRQVAISDAQVASLTATSGQVNEFYIHETSPYTLYKNYQSSCDPISWYGQTAATDGTYIDTATTTAGTCTPINVLIAKITGNTPIIYESNGNLITNVYYDQWAGDNFDWLDCNNNLAIIGYGDSFTPTNNGSYAIRVYKNDVGCTDTSACFNFTLTNTQDIQDATKIQAYPNPTTGQLTVDLGQYYNTIQIQVSNITGQVVQELSFDKQQQLNLDLKGVSGVYFLQLHNENGYLGSLKIVKE